MYIKTTKYREPGFGWNLPPGYIEIDSELIAEPDEIEDLFYKTWADEGYTETIMPIDDYTDEHIHLEAGNYFSKAKLEMIEEVLDDAASLCLEETTFKQIKRLMEMK